MASMMQFIRNILNLKDVVIEDVRFSDDLSTNFNVIPELEIILRPTKYKQKICPECKRKCSGYDYHAQDYSRWRAPDIWGFKVYLLYKPMRVYCEHCNQVLTEAVPWAFRDSTFTKDFEKYATFLALNMNKLIASKFLRIDWKTVGRCISRVREDLEPDPTKRYEGLVEIGIDETSYKKGHNYITTVVDLQKNTIVWVGIGHSKETLSQFFELLTPEQRASIQTVAGDGARWIDACINQYIPHATRVIDKFHVVSWAQEALDNLRKDRRRELFDKIQEIKDELKKDSLSEQEESKKLEALNKVQKQANAIKGATYALGKAPENLTENQQIKLEYLTKTDSRLFTGYKIKEYLRLILNLDDPDKAEIELDHFFMRASHCKNPHFKNLAYKIRRHKDNILNTIRTRLSSAKVEGFNNKIKLLIRKAYGFRNIQNMIDLIMLQCSNLSLQLPNRSKEWFSLG